MLMEIQGKLVDVSARVTGLTTSVDGVKTKVDDLVAWKHKIIGGAIVFGSIMTILGYLISQASHYLTIKAPEPQIQQIAPAAAPVVPAPPATQK